MPQSSRFSFRDFNPQPLRGDARFPPTWLDTAVPKVLARGAGRPFTPTNRTREHYLDAAEQLVRPLAAHQNADGALIDPVTGAEWAQTSPRFVASAAVLLHFGRCEELREHVYRGMDYCCARLAGGQAQSPDFWLRELMTTWFLLSGVVPAERRARWEKNLRAIDPETVYWHIAKDGRTPADLHNWAVYAAAGEAMREVAGLAPAEGQLRGPWGSAFYDKYMPPQLGHFTNEGMYRDPNDPMTYDMTTRLQFATPLAYGFDHPQRPALEELLRRGGLAQLLYVSPEGFAPFGGRSSQFHMQEAILAAVGELEARRYRTSDPRLAGAFKRQARLSGQSFGRWLAMSPFRHLKNGFPPEQLHGCEQYANYAVYSLFTASCLGLAALYADESIEEAITPAEIGGYVAEFSPSFHKIFAVCGQTQIEIDTAADFGYDATGLGRFHRAGTPVELALFSPIAATPKYTIPEALRPPLPTAIAPAWRNAAGEWVHLSAISEGLTCEMKTDRAEAEAVTFELTWTHAATQTVVQQRYELTDGELTLRTAVLIEGRRVAALRLIVPMLETDGSSTATTAMRDGGATVSYLGHVYEVDFAPGSKTELGRPIANRNAIYRPLAIESESGEVTVTLRIKREA